LRTKRTIISMTLSRRAVTACTEAMSSLEDRAEGVLVRDVEEAQRRDRRMDVHRVELRAEHALRDATLVESADRLDGRHVELLDALAAGHVFAALHVLGHHQADERLVAGVVVEREGHQAAQRVLRQQVVQVQFALGGAHAPVGLLQHRDVQTFLAAEVVVDHPLAGARGGGDLVDARTAQALAANSVVATCRISAIVRAGSFVRPVSAGTLRVGGRPRRAGAAVWTGSFMAAV
jgi:hypothetical protein